MLLALLRGKRTTTDTAVDEVAPQQGVQPVLTRPQLIARIITDAATEGYKLTRDDAGMIIDLWARARTDADGLARPGGRRIETLLTDPELDRVHMAMDALMPDEQRARPGSVHAELDRHTFGVDPVTGAASRCVIHTMDSTDRCAVVVAVVSA